MSFRKIIIGLSSMIMLSSYANAELIDSSTRSFAVVRQAQSSPQIRSNQRVQSSQTSSVNTPLLTNTSISKRANSVFPKGIEQGYWAMTMSVQGVANTVNFKDNYIDIHQFQCLPDGSFKKLDTRSYEMEASGDGMGLKRKDGTHYSKLKLISFEPQKSLVMHQSFVANLDLKRVMPEGVDLQYIYTPRLLPACPSYQQK